MSDTDFVIVNQCMCPHREIPPSPMANDVSQVLGCQWCGWTECTEGGDHLGGSTWPISECRLHLHVSSERMFSKPVLELELKYSNMTVNVTMQVSEVTLQVPTLTAWQVIPGVGGVCWILRKFTYFHAWAVDFTSAFLQALAPPFSFCCDEYSDIIHRKSPTKVWESWHGISPVCFLFLALFMQRKSGESIIWG